MKLHLRFVATLAVCLIAYGLLLVAFGWLNAPSDRSVVAGVALVIALLLFVPMVMRTIWRRQ